MQEHLYSVWDSKAEEFLPPFFAKTDGLAIRSFQEAINNQEHMFAKYPEDYTLFKLGSWFTTDGKLLNKDANISLGSAFQYLEAADYKAEIRGIAGGE